MAAGNGETGRPQGEQRLVAERGASGFAEGGPLRIFVSYSKADTPGDSINQFDREILDFLTTMVKRRLPPFELWWDEQELAAGEDWHARINPAVQECAAGLILMTNAFLDKGYIREHEYPVLVRRYQANEIPLYWLVLRPTSRVHLARQCPELVGLGGPQHLLGAPFPPLSKRGAAANPANGVATKAHVDEELVQILDNLESSLRRNYPEAFFDEPSGSQGPATGSNAEDVSDANFGPAGTASVATMEASGRVSARVPSIEGLVRRVEAGDLGSRLIRSLPDKPEDHTPVRHLGVVAEGGAGKSLLAAQVARLRRVGEAFPDGIVWAVFGQGPDLPAVYRRLLADLLDHLDTARTGLGGERARAAHEFARVADASNADRAATVIQGVLERSRMLVVLDDVWDRSVFQPLLPLLGGSRCLATSRKVTVLTKARLDTIHLERLDPTLARSFLVAVSGDPNDSSEADALDVVLTEANGLPLSLALYGGLARRGIEWVEVADRIATMVNRYGRGELGRKLRAQQVALGFLEDRVERGDKVDTHPELSWATMSERLLGLSIFPEDAAVPDATLARFWHADDSETRATIEVLSADRFVTFDRDAGELAVHDLTLDFLRLNAPPEIGLHQDLLAAHADLCSDPGAWWTIPIDDPYLWDHLARHLDRAGQDTALEVLARSPAWLTARIRASGPAGAISDCELVGVPHASQLARFAPQLERAARMEQSECLPVVPWTLAATVPAIYPRAQAWWPDVESASGHLGSVTNAAWSYDSSQIATASGDGTARIWDPTTGETLTTLAGHTGRVWGVAFNQDCTRVATASDDGTARIWDPTTGETLATLAGHTGRVWGVAFNQGSTRVATASSDGSARIWDPTTGETLTTLAGHTDWVWGVAFNQDSTRVATASSDGSARIWDPTTGETLTTLSGHTDWVVGVAFNQDSTRIATASDDETARIWDPATGETLTTLTGHTGRVWGVAFNQGSTRVATASGDGTARIWDPATGETLTTLTGHTDQVRGVAFNSDATRVATASDDGTARIWDPITGETFITLAGHTDQVGGVALNGDATRVATASGDGTARIWDPATGEMLTTLFGHTDWVFGVALNGDATRVATASGDGTARIWDPTTGETLTTLTGHADWVVGVAFNQDSTRIATASDDGTARIWDPTTGETLTTLTGHTGRVWEVAFNQDSTRIATASDDGTARIWDPTTGETLTTLTGHSSRVFGVAFNEDWTLIATASSDGTARIWDSATGETLTTLTGHTDWVRGVAFIGDATRIVTASNDGSVRIWDSTSGRCLAAGILRDAGLDVAVASTTGGAVRIVVAVGLGWNTIVWDPDIDG